VRVHEIGKDIGVLWSANVASLSKGFTFRFMIAILHWLYDCKMRRCCAILLWKAKDLAKNRPSA
jgi:hypothetical protein